MRIHEDMRAFCGTLSHEGGIHRMTVQFEVYLGETLHVYDAQPRAVTVMEREQQHTVTLHRY